LECSVNTIESYRKTTQKGRRDSFCIPVTYLAAEIASILFGLPSRQEAEVITLLLFIGVVVVVAVRYVGVCDCVSSSAVFTKVEPWPYFFLSISVVS